jgi:membrane protease YdiL (CAAX protease family)
MTVGLFVAVVVLWGGVRRRAAAVSGRPRHRVARFPHRIPAGAGGRKGRAAAIGAQSGRLAEAQRTPPGDDRVQERNSTVTRAQTINPPTGDVSRWNMHLRWLIRPARVLRAEDNVIQRAMLQGIRRRAARSSAVSGSGSADAVGFGWRRTAAAALPAAIPVAMMLLFHQLHRRCGDRRGYRIAMASYWLLCAAAPLALAGPRRLAGLVTSPRPALPRPRWLAVTALAVPPAGAVITELAPQLRQATGRSLAVAGAVGMTNAVAEELLWRGLPVALFPDDPVRGWIAPALGFTVWHLAPLSVRPHPRGRYPILAGAAMIGAGAGWIAWSTRSLRAVLLPHVLTDACGLRAARTIWTRDRAESG